MKHNVSGVVIQEGERYSYEAEVYTGNESYAYPDSVSDITNNDSETVDGVLFEKLEGMVLDDANERLRYTTGSDSIKDDETLDEYLGRTAKVWHPEELKK